MIAVVISLVVFWPFSASRIDQMTQANTLMNSNNPDDWRQARTLYQRISKSADEELAEEAQKQYYLSRRKSMLYRLDRAVSGLEKPEIREFNRGYLLQKQRQPEEALAFFKHFVDNYDCENKLVYVYAEASERLEQLMADKRESIEIMGEIELQLAEADELAKDPLTRKRAHKIWSEVVNGYLDNDFLQLQVQRAETGMVTYPRARPENDDYSPSGEKETPASNPESDENDGDDSQDDARSDAANDSGVDSEKDSI